MSRLDYLIQQMLDSELSEAERSELDALLEQDERLQNRFIHELEVESALRSLDGTFDVSERVMARLRSYLADRDVQNLLHRRRERWRTLLTRLSSRPWRIPTGMAALLLTLVGGIFLFSHKSKLATLTMEEGITRGDTTEQYAIQRTSTSIYGGEHVGLPRGSSASIAYRDGARLELGLEADMNVLQDPQQPDAEGKRLRLSAGRLFADIPPQPDNRPFTIETPQGTAAINAAKMELVTTAKATQVRVDSGLVHILRHSDGQAIDVREGQYSVIRNDLDLTVNSVSPLRCLFDDEPDAVSFWTSEAGPHAVVRQESRFGAACLRLTPQVGRITLSGMALPIREHPRPGEFRFITFAWRKDGGGRLALQIESADDPQDRNKQGRAYGYRFDAGEGEPIDGRSFRLSGKAPQAWWVVNRDLWKDFGDFTLTDATFICPDGDAAWYDRICLGRSPGDYTSLAGMATAWADVLPPLEMRHPLVLALPRDDVTLQVSRRLKHLMP